MRQGVENGQVDGRQSLKSMERYGLHIVWRCHGPQHHCTHHDSGRGEGNRDRGRGTVGARRWRRCATGRCWDGAERQETLPYDVLTILTRYNDHRHTGTAAPLCGRAREGGGGRFGHDDTVRAVVKGRERAGTYQRHNPIAYDPIPLSSTIPHGHTIACAVAKGRGEGGVTRSILMMGERYYIGRTITDAPEPGLCHGDGAGTAVGGEGVVLERIGRCERCRAKCHVPTRQLCCL